MARNAASFVGPCAPSTEATRTKAESNFIVVAATEPAHMLLELLGEVQRRWSAPLPVRRRQREVRMQSLSFGTASWGPPLGFNPLADSILQMSAAACAPSFHRNLILMLLQPGVEG